jgi:hypothetical protein
MRHAEVLECGALRRTRAVGATSQHGAADADRFAPNALCHL